MLRRILKNPQAMVGLFFMLLVLFAALLAPLLAPHNPEKVNTTIKYLSPCTEYPLGTDQLGRCELSRLLYGARYSIGMALPTLLMLGVTGLIFGTASACTGGVFDRCFIVLCDIFIAFPSLIMAIAVIGLLGNGQVNISIAIVLSMWAWFTRMVRSYAVVEMGKDYILASKIAGCSTAQIITRHLVPNIIPQYIVYLSTGIAATILMVSSFAFLGLGLPAGISEWGAMLGEARNGLYTHPEFLIYPGICILVTAAGFNLFGEALRDMLDPEEAA